MSLPANRESPLDFPTQHPPMTAGFSSFGCCVGKDRKSTRLNSSHANISYAVFCLKKKKRTNGKAPACASPSIFEKNVSLISLTPPQKRMNCFPLERSRPFDTYSSSQCQSSSGLLL